MTPAPVTIAEAEALLASAELARAGVRLEGFERLGDGRLQGRRDRVVEATAHDARATLARWGSMEPALLVVVLPLDGAPP